MKSQLNIQSNLDQRTGQPDACKKSKRVLSKTYATIYTSSGNVELVKLPGQVAYHMHKKFGYQSTLVTYKNDIEYNNQKEIPGVQIVFLTKPQCLPSLDLPVCRYLFHNARNIHVLNLYHYNKQTFLFGVLYKLLNPRGFLYVDLDDDLSVYNKFGTMIPPRRRKFRKILLRIVELVFLKTVDLFSNGNMASINVLPAKFPQLRGKIVYSPTGIDTVNVNRYIPKKRPFSEKENLILTVGRIGTYQKNNELFLDALALIDCPLWHVALVGPVENSFYAYYERFLAENPPWKNRVTIVGEVSDRQHLYQLYDRAKIFCLTSRYESFGIVLVEAILFGNYVITSNVLSAPDLTQGNTIGKVVVDYHKQAFAQALTDAMANQPLLEQNYLMAKAYCEREYDWPHVIDKLQLEITKRSRYA